MSIDDDVFADEMMGPPSDPAEWSAAWMPTVLPRASVVERERIRRPITPLIKRVLIALIAVVLILVFYEQIAMQLIYEQRQHHLAANSERRSPRIEPGQAALVLQIPAIGVNTVVVEGVDVDHLRGGPARERSGALPGDSGVMLIYGHRSAYGGPFERIGRLAAGDQIVARSKNGPIVAYQVTEVRRSTSVAGLKAPDDATTNAYIVLVSSQDGWFEGSRVVVVAKSLPISDIAARVPDPKAAATPGVPFGIDVLVANLAALTLVLGWVFMRSRTSLGLRFVVLSPVAAFAAVRVLTIADSVLPLTR